MFYGLISDILFGMTHLPGQIVNLFDGFGRKAEKNDFRDRNWAMTHFEERLMNQRRRQDNGTASGIISTDPDIQHDVEHNGENPSFVEDTDAANEDNHAYADGSQAVHYPDALYHGITMQTGDSKLSSQVSGRSKLATSRARHYAARSATHVLKFGLILPTDIMLSLTKGFHNAPKLYHDDRLEPLPRVVGIRSGFKAAGKVSLAIDFCLTPIHSEITGNAPKYLQRRDWPDNAAFIRVPKFWKQRLDHRSWKRDRRLLP